MHYREALDLIVATGARGVKAGLERTEALLSELGHPEAGLRGVLVAGTNGKGSVCAMVESACRAAGLRTALLTKPHLTSYRERFVLDGRPLDTATFAELVSALSLALEAVERTAGAPTQFEILTALGVLAAHRHGAEIVVCEVGLGGRLDSTNVLDLGVAVVTNVSLDHRELLGDTVEAIAVEKAGIIKPGNAVVTGTGGAVRDIVAARAAAVGAAPVVAPGQGLAVAGRSVGRDGVEVEVSTGELAVSARVPLCGDFQVGNAGLAVGVCAALRARGLGALTADAVRRGLERVEWRGRLQWIEGEPALLLDGAHNPAAVAAIVPAVREIVGERRLVTLVGCMADKDVATIVDALRPLAATPVFTEVSSPRAARAVDLARLHGAGARAVGLLPDALQAARALAADGGVVLVCGSLYLVGDVLRIVSAPLD